MAMMNENQIRDILEHYRLGTATAEELAFLESWYPGYYEESPEEMPLTERLATVDHVWQQLAPASQPPVKRIYPWRRIIAAAAVLLCVVAIAYLTWNSRSATLNTGQLAKSGHDIAPGANRAILTDASGNLVELDTTQTGIQVSDQQLAYANGAVINNLPAGKNQATADVRTLTLQTPKGGSYQVTLPDGSKVWLNAASSLQFPSSFEGATERTVQLTGEAYFEISRQAKAPFRVRSNGQTVEVLGTHFNMNSYPDEPFFKTTLLEGSIRVGSTILSPGQQAVGNASGMKTIEANVDAVIGWKNNYIVFQDEKIESVMRQISRWYDVEIEYEGEHPTDDFAGRVNRNGYVSQVLKKLELTNKVHFKIKERKIIVTK